MNMPAAERADPLRDRRDRFPADLRDDLRRLVRKTTAYVLKRAEQRRKTAFVLLK